MDQKEPQGLFGLQKEKSDFFQFQLQLGDLQEKVFVNNFTGDPAIPLIGKYSRNQYHFLKVDSIVALPLVYVNDKFVLEQDERIDGVQEVTLPKEIIDLVLNIPTQIVHNKPPKGYAKQKQQQQQPKKKKQTKKQQQKQQFKEDEIQGTIQEELQEKQTIKQDKPTMQEEKPTMEEEKKIENKEEFQDEKLPDYHPLEFKFTGRVKFIWTINSVQNEKIFLPLKKDPCLSYVNHNMIFEVLDFSKQKKLIQYLPLTITNPINVYEWTDDVFKSVSFGTLRSEYLSTHMSGGALCFSPNNMKLGVNYSKGLCSFWSLLLNEDNVHYIFHHWIIMDQQMAQLSSQILSQAKTINQILESFEMFGFPDIINQIKVLVK